MKKEYRTTPITPIIGKQQFIDIIEFLHDNSIKFENFREAAEALCPGEYVNFIPESSYESVIIDLLVKILEPNYDPNNSYYQPSTIEYWMYETNYGADFAVGNFIVTDPYTNTVDYQVDISTPAKLYDFLVSPINYNSELATFKEEEEEEEEEEELAADDNNGSAD